MAFALQNTVGIYSGARSEMEPHWDVCRTLFGGTPSMRKAAGKYLPPTARERKEEALYVERLLSSVLYGVYDETVKRIASLPFEKPPTVTGKLPGLLPRIVTNADRMGNSLSVFGASVYQDAIDRGVGMFLVDMVPTTVVKRDEDGNETRTVMNRREVDEQDARPYFVRIDPDNFIGAKNETIMGRDVCTELRVREWAYVPDRDGLRETLVERVRLYDRVNVSLWERNYGNTMVVDATDLAGKGDTSGYRLIEEPRPHGFPDGEIPLVPIYTNKRGFLWARPPMLGLAWLNVEHWQLTSIHKNALRYCLNPTRFIKGASSEDKESPPKGGEGASFITTSETAQMSFVEITGTSLQASERLIDKCESRMRSSATEPLQKSAATATGEMRAEIKDQSEAQRWVEAMEWALWHAFQIAAKWTGDTLPEDFNVTLHRASSLMIAANPARTASLQTDVRDGHITKLTYLKERKRSGDFADDFDPEAEAAAVAAEKANSDDARIEAMLSTVVGERQPKPPAPEKEGEVDDEKDDVESVPA